MHTDDFEFAFSEFLDRHEYDEAENALFSIVRAAFSAGWRAAGGEILPSEKLVRMVSDGK